MVVDGARGDHEERRVEDTLTWDQVEVRLIRILDERFSKVIDEIYSRSLTPLAMKVNDHDAYCAKHTSELEVQKALLSEIVEAKLIRRVEVAESNVRTMAKALTLVGVAAFTSMLGILTMVLTHQVKL